MSDIFSSSNPNTKQGTVNTDDFVARLRNVSITDSPTLETKKASPALQNACRPMDDSNFSREFMSFRTQIQRKLNKDVPNVSVQSLKTTSVSSSVETPCKIVSANPYVSNSTFSARSPAHQENTVAPVRSANPYDYQPAKAPSVMEATPVTTSNTETTQEVAPETKQERHASPVPNENNPFAKLVSSQKEKKAETLRNTACIPAENTSAHTASNSWLANIRCFGVLGIITGISLATFSMNSTTGTHQLTAMGLSLLIAGVTMFASVGLFQAATARS